MERMQRDTRTAIEDARVTWVAVVRETGFPHVTPLWFLFHEPRWWLCCSERSVKARALATNPRVSLAVECDDGPRACQGLATAHRTGFPSSVVEGFATKYDGWDITSPISPGEHRVLLEVTTERWFKFRPQ